MLGQGIIKRRNGNFNIILAKWNLNITYKNIKNGLNLIYCLNYDEETYNGMPGTTGFNLGRY
jgi:hypothetical protein